METTKTPAVGFAGLGLSQSLLDALAKNRIETPTPIQEQAIPVAVKGADVMGIAETGTGKTFAFSLPILERFLREPGKALIIVPTRELALQVEENVRKLTYSLQPRIRTACLIGGMSMYHQKLDLKANPRFIIATPGRMWDHMQQKTVSLADTSVVVLDEADRMFDMGFAPQIKRILEATPATRQTLCFSATMAPEIAQLAHAYMKDPVTVKVNGENRTNEKIAQELVYVHVRDKVDLLNRMLIELDGTVLVFTRTKHGAKKLTEQLKNLRHTVAEIHSNRSLGQRRHALDGFKSGRYRVLVATDVAARGIDVKDITFVINFDLPDAAEDYVHRIGRTGRAGKVGRAIAFAAPDQVRDVRSIERLIKATIPLSPYSQESPVQFRDRPYTEYPARPGRSFRPSPARGSYKPAGGGYKPAGSRFDARPASGAPRASRPGGRPGGRPQGGFSRFKPKSQGVRTPYYGKVA